MPNHVTNIITIIADKQRVEEIMEAVKVDDRGPGSLDFEKIIPMPDNIFRGDLGQEEERLYGKDNWHDWSVDNWGTKWNSYGYEGMPNYDGSNQIRFLSAWSRVDPIMERLSQMFPDTEFFYQWADENLGCNVGEQYYQNGEVIEECIPQSQSAQAYEMAADVMGLDLAEMGYQFDEDEGAYVYADEDMDEDQDEGFGGMKM